MARSSDNHLLLTFVAGILVLDLIFAYLIYWCIFVLPDKQVIIEKKVEVPVEVFVEKVVEVPVEVLVPHEVIVEKEIEVPVERFVEVERIVEVPEFIYIYIEPEIPQCCPKPCLCRFPLLRWLTRR